MVNGRREAVHPKRIQAGDQAEGGEGATDGFVLPKVAGPNLGCKVL